PPRGDIAIGGSSRDENVNASRGAPMRFNRRLVSVLVTTATWLAGLSMVLVHGGEIIQPVEAQDLSVIGEWSAPQAWPVTAVHDPGKWRHPRRLGRHRHNPGSEPTATSMARCDRWMAGSHQCPVGPAALPVHASRSRRKGLRFRAVSDHTVSRHIR